MQTLINAHGTKFDWQVVVNYMDDDLREQVHAEDIENIDRFFDRYCELHFNEFGEEFIFTQPNPAI